MQQSNKGLCDFEKKLNEHMGFLEGRECPFRLCHSSSTLYEGEFDTIS